MKNSLLKAFITLSVTCIAIGSYAQAKIKRPHVLIGANVSYSNPQSNFANTYKFGVGGEIFGGIGAGKTYLVVTLGTAKFMGQKENPYGNLTYNPVKIGLRQFLILNKIFVSGDVGTAYLKDKTMSNSVSRLSADVGAGVRLLGLEGGIYYNGWKSVHTGGFSGNVQVKLGWSITL